jgi:hypothetical protein
MEYNDCFVLELARASSQHAACNLLFDLVASKKRAVPDDTARGVSLRIFEITQPLKTFVFRD